MKAGELEKAVRDYVAKNPWMFSPQFETFRVERGVRTLLGNKRREAGITGQDWNGRVDLALSSGNHLIVLEFMRPGLAIDWDHVGRFERYVTLLRTHFRPNTAGRFNRVTGYLVADHLASKADVTQKILELKPNDMFAMDWDVLIDGATAQWREVLDILGERAPEDDRLKILVEE